ICRRGPWSNERLFPTNRKIYTDTDYQAHQERRKNGERLSLTPPPTSTDKQLVPQTVSASRPSALPVR
ncbi:MAG: hypothetical protein FWG68_06010, partial [Defluviitaleaceae bacterium]|nr:hypothetical protein [Defluviitaleaceae bacterium]